MKNREKTKIYINVFYALVWFIPLYFFMRDFFKIEDAGIFFERKTLDIVLFSIKQGFYSTMAALAIAIIPAYFAAYEKGIVSRLLHGLLFIPFFFPIISTVTIFSIIFNMEFFKGMGILYSLKAIIIANVFYNSPIFIKYISEGLKRVPKELTEALKMEGAGNIRIFFSGQLPLILPQIFRGFILVFTYCFTGFGIILSLGGIRFSTLEVEIASTLMGELNFSKAMIFGMIQFFILIILNLTGVFVKEYELEGEEEYKKQNIFFRGYSIVYLFLQYLIVASSFLFSFYNYYTGEFSIKAYMRIFSKSFNEDYEVIRGIMNSIGISAAVSFISIIVIYFIIKNYSRITDVIIFSNLGISGAFLAVALFYLNVLFNIPLLLLLGIGYILVSIPIGYSFMYQYIKKFPVNLLESSLLDCSNGFERYIYRVSNFKEYFFVSIFTDIRNCIWRIYNRVHYAVRGYSPCCFTGKLFSGI